MRVLDAKIAKSYWFFLFHNGDTVHVEAVQFSAPEVTIVFDENPKAAAANRAKAFAELSHTRVLVAAPHVLYPGIGHIRAEGKAYA